ncbi:ShlB/FhaC/HecB family hemolysin secretion/activation protein [Limnofasciculus baicalensis]|uniref:BamA/TamA family outer membrane protein n=1 Tax=Limnofasciculus baicalensis BBK-W-15 TaxID=2699891 RepID=A0AAE3GSX0_9CYAN|nr:ShlB/FhaC/HecB family hemolysin secretion/activation protein [Limnofasciculus baicalensis]MCP2730076.1 BamA/TamA family outer membrane protein [Limnofasciculus baicalensis BBK-W-15]
MNWYSRLNLLLCLFSVSTLLSLVGISSGDAKPTLTSPKLQQTVNPKKPLKVGKLPMEEANRQPYPVKPQTLNPSTNRQSYPVKPQTLNPSTNLKPTQVKPTNLKPQPPKPPNLTILPLQPPVIEAENLNTRILQARIIQAAILNPIILEAGIIQSTIIDPTGVESTVVHPISPNSIKPENTQAANLLLTPISPAIIKPDNTQVGNLLLTPISPAIIKPENTQGSHLQVSSISSATQKPETIPGSNLPNTQKPENIQLANLSLSPISSDIQKLETIPASNPKPENIQLSSLPDYRIQSATAKPETIPENHIGKKAQNQTVSAGNINQNANINSVEQLATSTVKKPDHQQQNRTRINPSPSNIKQTTDPPGIPGLITVERIEVKGSTVFGENELNPIIKPVEGRTVGIEELRKVADALSQLYLDRGYITSRAILNEESLSSRVVQIQVIEGSLEDVQVEGAKRINPNYVRSRIQLGASTPLNTGKLEDQLRLLRADPLFENVEASLKAGTGIGKSILVVRINEARHFEGNASIDNYSPPSVGSERLGGNITYRNLTGRGDTFNASYNRTTAGGAETWDLSYQIPVNAKNGTVQLRTSWNNNQVIQEPFRTLNIRGNSELYEITYRQPLIRTPREEFALSLGFTFQDGQTFTFAGPTPFGFGPDENGVSRTSVIKFGQDYTKRDVSGAWALRSLFSFGTGLFDATDNASRGSDIPDGQFISWLAQIQRVQVLNPDNFLIVQADLQLASEGLLPSQQFVVGGGQSVRGFRQNVRAGDNGLRFSVEDRITLERDEAGISTFQIAPFFDLGYVWNVSDNPNFLQEQKFIAGLGLGVLWQPLPRFSMRLDYALPLVGLDDRGRNAQDDGFYFSVNYSF